MERKIQLYGITTSKGSPIISGLERFNQLFKENPNKSFIIEIEIMDNGTTDSHVWYIIKMIIPAFIQGHKENGMLITKEEALEIIRYSTPIFEEKNKPVELFCWKTYKPICKLPREDLEIAIEYLHCFCLENFGISVGNIKII